MSVTVGISVIAQGRPVAVPVKLPASAVGCTSPRTVTTSKALPMCSVYRPGGLLIPGIPGVLSIRSILRYKITHQLNPFVTDHPKGATHVRPKGATGNAVFGLQTG